MFYMETTISIEKDSSLQWRWPLATEQQKAETPIYSPVTLETDSMPPHSSLDPTKVRGSIVFPTKTTTSPFLAPSTLPTTNSFSGNLVTTDQAASSSYSFQSSSYTALSLEQQRQIRDNETRKIILGSILGGVLGFAVFAILIFCALSYFGGKYNGAKRKRIRNIRNPAALNNKNIKNDSPGSFNFERSNEKNFSNKSQSTFTSYNSSPGIPINESPVPYIDSPFESQELLRFNPTNPQNIFSKHQKSPSGESGKYLGSVFHPQNISDAQIIETRDSVYNHGNSTIPNLISYSDEDIARAPPGNISQSNTINRHAHRYDSEIAGTMQNGSESKRSYNNSNSSSVYSPPANHNKDFNTVPNNESNLENDRVSLPNIYIERETLVSNTSQHNNSYHNNKDQLWRIIRNTPSIDDSNGEYEDLYFGNGTVITESHQAPDVLSRPTQ